MAGLKAAMLAPVEAKLAKAVETNRISQERADRLLDRLENRVDRIIVRTFPSQVGLRTFLGNSQKRLTKSRLGGKGIPSDCTSEGPRRGPSAFSAPRATGSGSSLTPV